MILIPFLLFFAAVLYSTVGHGGASAYLAVMALWNLPSTQMRPAALILNLFVASLTSYRFVKDKNFDFSKAQWLVLGAIPLSFWGGQILLHEKTYKLLLGGVLIFTSVRLLLGKQKDRLNLERNINKYYLLFTGSSIGLLAGLTGTGGGIFLTPLLIFMGWTDAKVAAGISAVFILFNSISGLIGISQNGIQLPEQFLFWIPAVVGGGMLGAKLGSQKVSITVLKKVLALVLLIAGLKLVIW